MTTIAPPSSNPELPVTFGAENHFRSKSRLQPHPFNQTTDLATDETPMEHGLGAENCFFRPSFYSFPARNSFDVSIPGFGPFPIGVYSVFHPWPIALSRRFTPRSRRFSSNLADSVRLCEPERRGYLRLFDPFWRKNYSHLVKNRQPRPSPLRQAGITRALLNFNAILPGFNPIQPCSTLFNGEYFLGFCGCTIPNPP